METNAKFVKMLINFKIGITSIMILLSAITAQADNVEPISQERLLIASANSRALDTDSFLSRELGFVSETVSTYSSAQSCLPYGGKYIILLSASSASQDSSIFTAPNGTLEITAQGSTSGSVESTGEANAESRLTSTFEVVGQAYYEIYAHLVDNASVILVGPDGSIVDQTGVSSEVSSSGLLSNGIHTLTVQVSTSVLNNHPEVSASYEFWMTVQAVKPSEDPRCRIEMSKQNYLVGEMVTALVLRLEYPVWDIKPVEFKIWLRMPDGLVISVRNDGADGALGVMGMFPVDFGPVTALEGSPDTIPGIYEFSCRLIDPITGGVFSEDRNLFKVVPFLTSDE